MREPRESFQKNDYAEEIGNPYYDTDEMAIKYDMDTWSAYLTMMCYNMRNTYEGAVMYFQLEGSVPGNRILRELRLHFDPQYDMEADRKKYIESKPIKPLPQTVRNSLDRRDFKCVKALFKYKISGKISREDFFRLINVPQCEKPNMYKTDRELIDYVNIRLERDRELRKILSEQG